MVQQCTNETISKTTKLNSFPCDIIYIDIFNPQCKAEQKLLPSRAPFCIYCGPNLCEKMQWRRYILCILKKHVRYQQFVVKYKMDCLYQGRTIHCHQCRLIFHISFPICRPNTPYIGKIIICGMYRSCCIILQSIFVVP